MLALGSSLVFDRLRLWGTGTFLASGPVELARGKVSRVTSGVPPDFEITFLGEESDLMPWCGELVFAEVGLVWRWY